MQAPARARSILLAGTGRSGTTLLLELLGRHRSVHAIPVETRFMVDPDGLLDLVDALTTRYSPVRAREALYRFERLMRVHLATPGARPYAGHDYPSLFGPANFNGALDRFCDDVLAFEYDGTDFAVEPDEGRFMAIARRLDAWQRKVRGLAADARATLARPRLRQPRFFADRAALCRRSAALVDELFGASARAAGKDVWCEKTPHNLFHLDFLHELFPEALLVHIKRDPRGVAHSLTRQPWAPADLGSACRFTAAMCEAWTALRERAPPPAERYVELRLEDLVQDPLAALAPVLRLAGLASDFGPLPAIDPAAAAGWRTALTADQRRLVDELLAPSIRAMGYSP